MMYLIFVGKTTCTLLLCLCRIRSYQNNALLVSMRSLVLADCFVHMLHLSLHNTTWCMLLAASDEACK